MAEGQENYQLYYSGYYSPAFGMYPGYAGSFPETRAVPGGAAENKVKL